MIGNDFQARTYAHVTYCSECHRKIQAGTPALVSVKGGKVRKRICGEECRLAFDDRFWRAVARSNELRMRRRIK